MVSYFSLRDDSTECLEGWIYKANTAGALSDCSLIVPTFKRPSEIIVLMQALARLPDIPFEVIIVDGSPNQETETSLKHWAIERDLPFDLIYISSPAGLTRQRNVGIEACRGEFIFFLDDDCLPYPNYFLSLQQAFHKDTSGEVGAVGATIINEMDLPLHIRWRLRFALGIVPRGEPRKYYSMGTSVPTTLAKPFTGTREVDIVPGGASAYRRIVLEQHRFSRFFYGYAQGEDLEISLRIGRQWKLLWSGDARTEHHHAPGGRPPSREKGRMDICNRFFIWKRHTHPIRLIDYVRFAADVLYIGLYDLVSFMVRPKHSEYLSHAAGIIYGSVECLLRPPLYQEPPVKREYKFHLIDLQQN